MYKILLIDDEEKHLQATEKYLQYHGFNVVIEKSSERALQSIRKINPDIILLDIMMPNMDGYKFVEELQLMESCREIPFLFVTAKGMTPDRIKGYKNGCSAYVPKPFDPDELIEIIHNILKRKQTYIEEVRQIKAEFQNINITIENQYSLLQIASLKLTRRESHVLQFVIQGLKNREIALRLRTSVRNIEKYLCRLLNKSNCRNRTELVKLFYSNQLYIRANDGNRTRE